MEYTHSFDIVIRSILIWVIHSPILFRDASLAVGQSYDCPSASEATLKNVGKIDVYQTTIMSHLSIHLMSKPWCVLWTPWLKWQYILDQWNVRLATRPSQLHRSDCLGQQVFSALEECVFSLNLYKVELKVTKFLIILAYILVSNMDRATSVKGDTYHEFSDQVVSLTQKYNFLLVASPMSLWFLWWPPTGSSMFMVVVMLLMYSVLHCLYSVGNKITTVETLYSTIYYSKYFIELNFEKSTQYVALWTHKRHPIPRPFGRAMECLLWVLQQKLTVL